MKYDQDVFKNIGLISQLGISMLTPIIMCVLIGRFLDAKFGWSVVVPSLILGIMAGARNTYILAMDAVAPPEDEEDD